MHGPRLRLLFLLNSLPAAGGAEKFVLGHVRHADRSRFDILVAQLGGSQVLVRAFEELGTTVHNLGERRRPDPRSLARLAVLLRTRRVDILQAHVGYSCLVARLVGRLSRVPTIVTTEQAMFEQYSPATRRGLAWTRRLAHGQVYISRASFETFASRDPTLRRSEPLIIPNGVDSVALAEAASRGRPEVRAELGLGPEDLAYANVARLHPDKGQRVLIDAFAEVAARLPRARLFLVGVGPLEAELRSRVLAHRVDDRVTFLKERTDVPRLLGGFDVYVHPALNEALGIAPLEAMAAGLPIIGTRVGGLPEYIEHGSTGWLVPPGDAAALAATMAGVAARPGEARAVAARGQARIRRHYDIRDSVAAYETLYRRLFERSSP